MTRSSVMRSAPITSGDFGYHDSVQELDTVEDRIVTNITPMTFIIQHLRFTSA